MFIVLEGIDGCGKTTQARLLYEWFMNEKYNVFLTAEPTDNRIGKFIKEILSSEEILSPETLSLLFSADRYEHIKQEIEPALKDNKIVISERYYYSTIAYQSAQGVDMKWLKEINSFAMKMKPDLAIFLDIRPELATPKIREKDRKFREIMEKSYKKYRDAQRHYLNNRKALYGKLAEKKTIRELEDSYKRFLNAEEEYERERSKYLKFEKFEKPTTLEANTENYERFLSRVRENYLHFDDIMRIDGSKPVELVFDDIKRALLKFL